MQEQLQSFNRIIFLDFDGTLHPYGVLAIAEDFSIIETEELFCWLPILEDLLKDHPDVGIVISSDWIRWCDNDKLKTLLKGLGDRFAGIVDKYTHTSNRVLQISQYIETYGIKDYIVLDDDANVLHRSRSLNLNPGNRMIWVSPLTGISDLKIRWMIHEWLTNKKVPLYPIT